jgi:ribosome-binding protein aMBF1 (putative translation factor)
MAKGRRLSAAPRKRAPRSRESSYHDRLTFPPEELGTALRGLRQQRDMTQAELAKRAGLHKIYLAKIEGGRSLPAFKTLQRIAKALGVTLLLSFEGK